MQQTSKIKIDFGKLKEELKGLILREFTITDIET